MKTQYLFVLVLAFLVTSCDPALYMTIESKGKKPSSIIITFSKTEGYKFGNSIMKYIDNEAEEISLAEGQENSIKIEFGKDSTYDEVELLFGIGSWSEAAMNYFAEVIKSIRISKNGKTRTIEKQEEIFQFLHTHKKGRRLVLSI